MKTWKKSAKKLSDKLDAEGMLKARECLVKVLSAGNGHAVGDLTSVAWTPLEMRLATASILGASVAKNVCPGEAFNALMSYLYQATDEEMNTLIESVKNYSRDEEVDDED